MTTKQLARKNQIGFATLNNFIASGMVDAPAIPDAWTEQESAAAAKQIIQTIAYARGWEACALGYRLEERVPRAYGSDIDANWHKRYQKRLRKAKGSK